ncbi:uncharacterized protein UDID_17972 [Ustilago sp. UG-2017a]|nr:uncharacterized protein UDID_17972 [Ustilago sp. UG-2017a]
MAGDNDHQASTGEAARRTRKGKTPQRVQIDEEATDGNETEYFDNEDEGGSESDDDDNRYDYRTLAKILETVPKLTSPLLAELNETKMFHADARKLIKEIRVMQTETSLLGAPFSNDALYSALQRCTIRHPVYKETVTTVHQVSFDALATALTTRQSAIESVPGQKVDPRQASARIAGGNEEQAEDTESDTGSIKTKPKRIRCWVCKCYGHGASKCDASVAIPENSPLTKTN